MGSDDEAIRKVHAAWIDAVNGGDLAGLLGLMSDDAVFFNPGGPPAGRAEFAEGFKNAHREFHLRCASELMEVAISGDIGYTVCRDSLSLAPRSGGEMSQLRGHRLTIYRRQGDGRWLLARDAHTLVFGELKLQAADRSE